MSWGKPAIYICKSKDADQLRGTIPLLSNPIFKPPAIICSCTSLVCVEPDRKPERLFSHDAAQNACVFQVPTSRQQIGKVGLNAPVNCPHYPTTGNTGADNFIVLVSSFKPHPVFYKIIVCAAGLAGWWEFLNTCFRHHAHKF